MSTKSDSKDIGEDKQLGDGEKSNLLKSTSKASELENIRKNLAKRSLDAKFDLQGTDYKPIENIGIGAYGVVCSAVHTKSGDRVAIKKIPSVFEALSIAKRTYREIKILKHFKHDNIISIREILMPKQNVKNFKDIYVVFDLMESDLHRIIYSKQELSEEHIRYFLYQILRGLKYIHSANVIHRDLKPSNVLVNEDCHLRIGDFGMARGVFYTPDEPSYYMTQYVATRWYRAPEILLSMLEYGAALDMWSVGCIFAEMMGRKHLFPGKDYISQVKLIVGVLGTPSESVLKNCHHDILKKMIKNFGKKEPISWEKLFPKASKKSLDLVSKMLVLNPAERISVDQALSHRLLNNYHDPSDEPICVPTFNFDFEKEDMDKDCLRSAIMDEILSFHQPKHPTFSFNAFLRPAPKSEETTLKDMKADTILESALFSTSPASDVGTSQKELGKEITFKTPGYAVSKSSSKLSPVSVDTGKLQLIPSFDIEMLSAQSIDGRTMDTQHTDLLTISKEIKEEKPVLDDKKIVAEKDFKIAADKKGGNTISEDTKALVKQALMNATQRRQRAESQGDDSKDSKPITAAQRQREREERRRKKKERALEKVKKSKEKKRIQEPPPVALSCQDIELLRRWTVMQKPGNSEQVSQSPPHPGPAVSPPQAASVSSSSMSRSSTNSGSIQNNEASLNSQQNTLSTGCKPRQILAKNAAPTSVTLGSSVNITSNQVSSSGAVLFPSTQLNLSQANFIPVIAVPSCIKPGHLEIKRIFPPTSVTAQIPVSALPSSLQTSNSTKALLHTAVLMRNRDVSNTATMSLNTQNVVHKGTGSDTVQPGNISPVLSAHNSFSNMCASNVSNEATTGTVTHDQFTVSTVMGAHLLKSESAVLSKHDKLSPRSQGNDLLDFLNQHLKESPREKTISEEASKNSPQSLYLDQNHCMQEQNSFILAGPSPADNQQHSLTPPPPYNNYSKTCSPEEQLARSNSTPSLLRQDSHSPNLQQQELRQRSSVPVITCRDQLFSNFPTQDDFTQSFQTAESNQPKNFSQSNTTTNFQSDFIPMNNYQDFSQTAPVVSFDSQIPHVDMLFHSSSEFSLQMHHQQICHQVFENTGSYDEFNSFPSSTASRSSSAMQYHQSFSEYSQLQSHQQNFSANQGFQNTDYVGAAGLHNHVMPQHIHETGILQSNLQSAASVTSSGSFTSSMLQQSSNIMAGQSAQGTSHSSHRLTVNCSNLPRESNTELIALLTKQLSKQHVMDIVPSLALTPRGTGAGYGVGMDLDAMLTDAQDNASVRAEQSPLSSSLLADWLDISENISQADLEALEREMALQSPMQC